MIRLTRLNHSLFILNADLIEEIQETPDTMITLSSGRRFAVLEPPDEVVRRVVDYRRQVGRSQPRLVGVEPDTATVREA